MSARLLVTPARCVGCRTCEITCAFSHPTPTGPGPTRIHVFPIQPAVRGMPVVCLQCDSAACVLVCPTGALARDERTGAVLHTDARCILCRACVAACPFGNIEYDAVRRRITKCDLCGGDPQCARYCPSRALEQLR